jgi:hypothetical protein
MNAVFYHLYHQKAAEARRMVRFQERQCQKQATSVKLAAVIAVRVESTVLWGVIPRSRVEVQRRFRVVSVCRFED